MRLEDEGVRFDVDGRVRLKRFLWLPPETDLDEPSA
jgi:hypothetical protein